MKTTTETFSTLDLHQAAFLELAGIRATLKLTGNQVSFHFMVTPGLHRILDRYNNNLAIPCPDYIAALKTQRGRMLAFRNGR